MVSFEVIVNNILFLISLVCFVYGMKKFILRDGGALYPKFVTLGFGAFMAGRLQSIVSKLVEVNHFTNFDFGFLGTVGCFMFLFTANCGIFDKIIDDRRTETKKYRLIPIVAPIINIAICMPVWFSDCSVFDKVICSVVLFFVVLSSYLNFKHAIFPDVENGIADTIKGYNYVATLFSFFTMAEYTSHMLEMNIILHISHIGICVCIILVFPLLGKGVKIWTT